MSKIWIRGTNEPEVTPISVQKTRFEYKVRLREPAHSEVIKRMKERGFSHVAPYLLFCERELNTSQEAIEAFKEFRCALYKFVALLK